MRKKKDFKDPEQIAQARECPMRLYAASTEKARIHGDGQMTITKEDLERVSNIELQKLLGNQTDVSPIKVGRIHSALEKNKQKKTKLEVDLIPANAWGQNVRAVVSDSSWYSLRIKFGAIKSAYSLATDPGFLAIKNDSGTSFDPNENYSDLTNPLVCGSCGKSVSESLHLHEKWMFDDENYTQKLTGFVAVCEDCHNAIHFGRSNKVGLGNFAKAHLKKINGWTESQLNKHLDNATSSWLKRIDFKYQLDLTWLIKEGLLSAKEIHLNWLNRPPRVYDHVDAISWARTMLENPDTVILDTETTGLIEGAMANPDAEIVELAIITVTGQVLYDSRFKPRYSIPQRTTEIHGITNQSVKNSPKFPKEYSKILQILTGKIVISYNARFDGKILANTCRLNGINPPEDMIWECAMKVYKAYQEPDTRFSRLPGARHDALSDCKATLKLIKKISRNEDI